MKKVNILIGTLSTGGAERVVSNLSFNFGSDVSSKIILFGNEAKIDYEYSGELTYLDKDIHKGFSNKIITFINRVRKISKIKKKDPEVPMLSFLEYPNLINLLSHKKGKTIISVRNHMSTKFNKGLKSFFWNSIIKIFYNRADMIVVVSNEIRNDLVQNYGLKTSKIKVIYNSYEINKINELMKNQISNKYENIFNKPVVITVGRLNRQKGQWHLINSFKEVLKTLPDTNLVIMGDGRMKAELEKLAGDFLDRNIHFIGFDSNPFKYISRSSVFVLTSLYEGFPNALCEAMACKIPVISSDCKSGPREILAPKEFGKEILYDKSQGRYGILIPPFSTNSDDFETIKEQENFLSNKIIQVISDELFRDKLKEKSSRRIKDFDISELIKDWEKII